MSRLVLSCLLSVLVLVCWYLGILIRVRFGVRIRVRVRVRVWVSVRVRIRVVLVRFRVIFKVVLVFTTLRIWRGT